MKQGNETWVSTYAPKQSICSIHTEIHTNIREISWLKQIHLPIILRTTTPMYSHSTAPLRGILPEHRPTVYVCVSFIGIYVSITIMASTVTMSRTCIVQIHFNNMEVFIKIIIFLLLPVFNPIWLTVPNSTHHPRFNSTHIFLFKLTQISWFSLNPITRI